MFAPWHINGDAPGEPVINFDPREETEAANMGLSRSMRGWGIEVGRRIQVM